MSQVFRPALETTKLASFLDNPSVRTIIGVAFTGTTALTHVSKQEAAKSA